MKWFIFLLALMTAMVLQGCGGTRSGDEAEDTADAITEADTAQVDANSNPENLPVISADPVEQTADNSVVSPQPDTTIAGVGSDSPPPVQTPDFKPEESNESGNGDLATYTVKKGDTLMKIAYNLCGDIMKWKDIYNVNSNKLRNANTLTAGMTIKYQKPDHTPNIDRNGDSYLIKNGDTLGSIAFDLYGKKSKWKKLYENNRSLIKDPNKIYTGFYLYYQATESEKMELEKKPSKIDESEKLGNTESLPDSAMIRQTPKKVGGLNALSTQGKDRSPASNKN